MGVFLVFVTCIGIFVTPTSSNDTIDSQLQKHNLDDMPFSWIICTLILGCVCCAPLIPQEFHGYFSMFLYSGFGTLVITRTLWISALFLDMLGVHGLQEAYLTEESNGVSIILALIQIAAGWYSFRNRHNKALIIDTAIARLVLVTCGIPLLVYLGITENVSFVWFFWSADTIPAMMALYNVKLRDSQNLIKVLREKTATRS